MKTFGAILAMAFCMMLAHQTAQAIELWSDKTHKFEIGGNLNYGAFYHGASVDDAPSFDPTSVRGRSEIDFIYKGKINDDWSFGAKVEIRIGDDEGGTSLTKIELDEHYISLKSKTFGELVLGSDKSPAGEKQVKAPEFLAEDLNSIEGQDFRVFSGLRRGVDGGLLIAVSHFDTKDETDIDIDEDFNKVIYYTPRLEGLQFGVSYTPNAGDEGNGKNNRGIAQRRNDQIKDAVSLNLNYENSFAGLDVEASAGYLIAKRVGADPDVSAWNIGAQIGFDVGEGKLKLGGGYLMGEDLSEGEDDGVVIVGFAYERDAWKVGIHYGWSNNESARQEETTHEIELGGSYRFTDYMAISAMVEYVQSEVEITGPVFVVTETETGVGIITRLTEPLPSYDADGVGVGLIFSVNF